MLLVLVVPQGNIKSLFLLNILLVENLLLEQLRLRGGLMKTLFSGKEDIKEEKKPDALKEEDKV